MSEEDKHKLSKILYYSDIHPADTVFINNIIYDLEQKLDQIRKYIKRDEFVDYIPNSKSYLRLMKIRCDLLKILGDKENE